jgi:hypothetical protein
MAAVPARRVVVIPRPSEVAKKGDILIELSWGHSHRVPTPNSVKYFATLELLEQVKDRTRLAKVTHALKQYWPRKNAAKKNGLTGKAPKQHSSSVSVTMAG